MISPVIPCATGGGLAMRAFQTLRAFATQYEITLLVPDFGYSHQSLTTNITLISGKIAHYDLNPYRDLPTLAQSICYRAFPRIYFSLYAKPSDWRFINRRRIAKVCASYSNEYFDLIHIHRLYMTPFAQPFLDNSSASLVQLDLDDIESVTRFRIGELYRLNGKYRQERIMKIDARQYSKIERTLLPRFDRVFVCSETDKEKLISIYNCRTIEVIPNTVNIGPARERCSNSDIFTLLFVGTFSYYPNQDGIHFFCHNVLPLIRKSSPKRFQVKIIGRNMPVSLAKQLKQFPEVELLGWVDNLQSFYQDSDAIIVPIRAGGGTRIKILEAFSYQRPVITTSMGVEGIAAEDGKEIL
ncbi:MAG: glycosyltransferase, partial [Acidobacteriota bacterium]